ncbi:hypothetical protein CVT24_012544 [Panaeolus cyanescens]|uniref:Uncharacterized protein n=1 Tax=Panaeolus cyanescens TaxID=181874 RepID=A0A409W655_9AGAR|nr:hypothetical protein CVT24_012544 [Panaeolus cyanescens]
MVDIHAGYFITAKDAVKWLSRVRYYREKGLKFAPVPESFNFGENSTMPLDDPSEPDPESDPNVIHLTAFSDTWPMIYEGIINSLARIPHPTKTSEDGTLIPAFPPSAYITQHPDITTQLVVVIPIESNAEDKAELKRFQFPKETDEHRLFKALISKTLKIPPERVHWIVDLDWTSAEIELSNLDTVKKNYVKDLSQIDLSIEPVSSNVAAVEMVVIDQHHQEHSVGHRKPFPFFGPLTPNLWLPIVRPFTCHLRVKMKKGCTITKDDTTMQFRFHRIPKQDGATNAEGPNGIGELKAPLIQTVVVDCKGPVTSGLPIMKDEPGDDDEGEVFLLKFEICGELRMWARIKLFVHEVYARGATDEDPGLVPRMKSFWIKLFPEIND